MCAYVRLCDEIWVWGRFEGLFYRRFEEPPRERSSGGQSLAPEPRCRQVSLGVNHYTLTHLLLLMAAGAWG